MQTEDSLQYWNGPSRPKKIIVDILNQLRSSFTLSEKSFTAPKDWTTQKGCVLTGKLDNEDVFIKVQIDARSSKRRIDYLFHLALANRNIVPNAISDGIIYINLIPYYYSIYMKYGVDLKAFLSNSADKKVLDSIINKIRDIYAILSSHGIYHSDISSYNILVESKDGEYNLLLTDFENATCEDGVQIAQIKNDEKLAILISALLKIN